MMRHPLMRALLLLLLTAQPLSPAHADEPIIEIRHAWMRSLPPVSRVNSAYMEIHNRGAVEDRLIRVTTQIAGTTEIHRSMEVEGQVRMQPVAGLTIPAQGSVTLASGGYHLMLNQLSRAPRAGERVIFALHFERAGVIPVSAEVRADPAATAMQHAHP